MVAESGSPRVSVVVPVRDRRAMLGELLVALEAQSFRDFEVIVVDDASTDGSAEEAEAAASRGAPVRVVRTGGGGAVAARLAGVAVARGDVLAFTDSDCVPTEHWLERAMEAIDEGAELVQGLTRPTGPVGPLERSIWAETEDGLYATCNVLYRRSAYDRAGGFLPDGGDVFGFRAGRLAQGLGFGEDSLLGWRVRRSGPTAFAPGAVVEHQVLPFDGRGAVSRAWQAGGFPALVREVPELRETLLAHRYFLGRRGQLWLLTAVVSLLGRHRRVALAAAFLWARTHAVRVDRSRRRWPAELAVVLALDVVVEAALVGGTLRTRTVVL